MNFFRLYGNGFMVTAKCFPLETLIEGGFDV
jgi:hypothetical protein